MCESNEKGMVGDDVSQIMHVFTIVAVAIAPIDTVTKSAIVRLQTAAFTCFLKGAGPNRCGSV